MEDVLDLYAQPIDPERPLVCFDEKLCVLISDVHEPIPATPKTEEKRGKVEKKDYEYQREGSSKLECIFCPLSRLETY